jgi:hypothetical protein
MAARLLVICGMLSLLAGVPARAADRTLSVTIYAGDLALVQDRRDIEVKGGRPRIEFADRSGHQHRRTEL